MNPAFEFLLSNFHIFETNAEAKKVCQEFKVLTVGLDGTTFDWRGVMSGGEVKIREETGRKKILSEIDQLRNEISEIIKIFEENECLRKKEILIYAKDLFALIEKMSGFSTEKMTLRHRLIL